MKKVLLVIVCAMGFSATAFAALNNNNKPVSMVESRNDGLLIVHLGEAINSQPACATYNTIVACDMAEDWCMEAGRIALAAQLAGRDIEFNVSA